MTTSLQIDFRGCDPSSAVRSSIEQEFERLELHDRRIASGRVTVTSPGGQQRHGAGFQVHILLTMPPDENIVVSHSPEDKSRSEHADVAVKDAFAVALRQIDDRRGRS